MRHLSVLSFLSFSLFLLSCIDNASKGPHGPKDISSSPPINAKHPKVDSKRSKTDTIITHLVDDNGNDTIFYITHFTGQYYPSIDLIISLSDSTRKTFSDDYWDSINNGFPPLAENSIRSDKVFVYKQKSGAALFLFTYGGEGEDGRVCVISVQAHSIRKVVDTSLFSFPVAFTDIDNDGKPEIIGRSYGEVFGLNGTINTYDPNYVYTMDANGCRLNNRLTELYNKQHYVWAKRAVKDNVGVIEPAGKGAPYFVLLKTSPKTGESKIIKLGKTVPDSLLQ